MEVVRSSSPGEVCTCTTGTLLLLLLAPTGPEILVVARGVGTLPLPLVLPQALIPAMPLAPRAPRAGVGLEPWEDEHGLDVQLFEDAQVGLDALGEGEGETAGGGEEGLAGWGVVEECLEVVRGVDAQSRFRECGEGECLDVFLVREVV